MHPPHTPGADAPEKTAAAPRPAPTGRRLPLHRDERLVLTNILLLLALPLLAYTVHLYRAAGTYDLALPVQSDRPVAIRVFLNLGAGYEPADQSSTPVAASPDRSQVIHAVVPAERLLGLRLYFDHAASANIHLRRGSILARGDHDEPATVLPLHGLHAGSDLPRLDLTPDDGVSLEVSPNPTDANAQLDLARPILLPFDTASFVQDLALGLLLYMATVFGALLAWRRLRGSESFRQRADRGQAALEHGVAATGRAIRAHPLAALWLAAVASVAVSCYPVVFCGKSFVSPNICGRALYDTMPTLPGDTNADGEDSQGSDTQASLVQSIPYAVMERRALLHGEFPLWNRYNAAAGPLLGQGLSMMGDPLHWMVLLLGANSGAWDLKFLLARVLFAAGVGLSVRAATGRLAAALLLAFSACFVGFFTYRFNHPAYFGLCYSPWILYAWLETARERGGPGSRRRAVRWTSLLLLANWLEFSSGTVKETSVLIAGLNATGLLVFALSDARPTLASKGRALAGLVWAGVCWVLVSAPLWHTLLDAIVHSWSDYIQPRAWQLQPGLLLGLFDDIFYRQANQHELLLDPAANFVALLGVAFAGVSFRVLARQRMFLALSLGALLPLAMVFGVVPPSWIKLVPFLGNVTHIDNAFSCVLIIHLLVLAGYGLERCRERLLAPDWGVDLALALALVAGLFGAFLGLTQANQRADFNPLRGVGEVQMSAFFWPYVLSLLAAFVMLPLLWRQFRRDRGACALGVAPWMVLCLAAMLWRGGQQTHAVAGFDRYVMHPPARADLLASSPAVARLQSRQAEAPGRCLGLGDNLVAGFIGVYGLESASGPDALQNRYYHVLLTDSALPLVWHWRLIADRQLATRMRPFYDMLNVRFYADRPSGPVPPPITGTHSLGRYDLDLYESDTVWPRAFFTDTLAVTDGNKDLFALLAAGDGRPFAAVPTSVLAGPDGGPLHALLRGDGSAEGRAIVPASGYQFKNHQTTFRVHAPGPGVAALLEAYQDPANVRVEINGRTVPSFRVNEAFAGVFLPTAGDYEVSFRYGPRDLPLLLGMSALGLALLAGTAFWLWRQDRKDQRRFAV